MMVNLAEMQKGLTEMKCFRQGGWPAGDYLFKDPEGTGTLRYHAGLKNTSVVDEVLLTEGWIEVPDTAALVEPKVEASEPPEQAKLDYSMGSNLSSAKTNSKPSFGKKGQ